VAGTDDSVAAIRGLGVARGVEWLPSMRIAFALLVALAGSASADAPGEYVVVAPAPAPVGRDVMADRWAVGLGVGSIGLAAPNATTSTNYGVAELSLRFRATPHLELEASFAGGDSQDKSTSLGAGALALRYRFHPREDWNVWFMGGLGAVTIQTEADMTRVERPMIEAGAGIERRFGHLALQAELRAIGTGEPKQPQTVARAATAMPSDETLAGGELTLGASFYF
jgi:hypothetical protein